MKRKGRPRNTGPREPSGRAQRMRDKGTDELRARREWLAGEGDMVKTTYPLGILLANGAITEEQHTTGCRMAWLYAVVYGKVSIGAAAYERSGGHMDRPEHEDEAVWQAEVKRLLKALSGISRHVRDDVVSLVVYERVPKFMRPGFQADKDVAHSERVRAGLRLLAGQHGSASV